MFAHSYLDIRPQEGIGKNLNSSVLQYVYNFLFILIFLQYHSHGRGVHRSPMPSIYYQGRIENFDIYM